MKSHALALLTLAASLAVPGALAQGVVLKATIPFPFNVGETYMPAGDYIISSPLTGIVHVQSADSKHTATVTTSKDFNDSKGENKLLFDKLGNRYFFHRILCPETARMNVDLPVWNAERKARTREAKLERPEEILVATR